jgi:hypothetical protein
MVEPSEAGTGTEADWANEAGRLRKTAGPHEPRSRHTDCSSAREPHWPGEAAGAKAAAGEPTANPGAGEATTSEATHAGEATAAKVTSTGEATPKSTSAAEATPKSTASSSEGRFGHCGHHQDGNGGERR